MDESEQSSVVALRVAHMQLLEVRIVRRIERRAAEAFERDQSSTGRFASRLELICTKGTSSVGSSASALVTICCSSGVISSDLANAHEAVPRHAACFPLPASACRPTTSEESMTLRSFCVFALSAALCTPLLAAEDTALIESVKTGCEKEIATYCSTITPGEGRVLSCLYSHEDKLSNRCEYALYDAAAQLERAVAALSYLNSECDQDMQANCATTKPGEGRILQCLKKSDKVSDRCKTAIRDIGQK